MKAVDCVIVGGSYGGLSAALALGRSLRRVVVVDEGLPCNRYTPHSQNFLTRDGSAPSEIAAIGKQQIQEKYKTVDFVQGRVSSVKKSDTAPLTCSFEVTTRDGDIFEAKKILFATGVKDIFPNIPGFAECWGKSVIHCPYCHGFEYHSEATGMLLRGDITMHMAPMIRNLTPNLKIFGNGQILSDVLLEEEMAQLETNGIEIISSPIKELQHDGSGYLENVILDDGTSIPLKAMYAALPVEVNAKTIMDELGCEFNDGGYLAVNTMQKTNVPGIFGCGDATTMLRSVAYSVSSGNIAGALINMELSGEAFAAQG